MADDDDWSAEDGKNEMDDVKAERHIFSIKRINTISILL